MPPTSFHQHVNFGLTEPSTSLSMPPQTTRTQNANTTTQSKTVA